MYTYSDIFADYKLIYTMIIEIKSSKTTSSNTFSSTIKLLLH